MMIGADVVFPAFLVVLVVILIYLRRRRGRNAAFLLCLSLFCLYLFYVAKYTLLPLRLDAEYIEVMRRDGGGLLAGVNLVPFRDLGVGGLLGHQVIGNFLMGVPFGFALPFIARLSLRRLVFAVLLFSMGIELVQSVVNLLYGFAYRAIDINDVIANFAGGMTGLAILALVGHVYLRLATPSSLHGFWGYVGVVFARTLGVGKAGDSEPLESEAARSSPH